MRETKKPLPLRIGRHKVRTIDINQKEWKKGPYFSAWVVLDFGLPSETHIPIPFQYGYGDHYEHIAGQTLQKMGIFPKDEHPTVWRICRERGVILRRTSTESILREVKQWATENDLKNHK